MKFFKGLLIGLNVIAAAIGVTNGIRTFIRAFKEEEDARIKASYYEGYIDGCKNDDKRMVKKIRKQNCKFSIKKEA